MDPLETGARQAMELNYRVGFPTYRSVAVQFDDLIEFLKEQGETKIEDKVKKKGGEMKVRRGENILFEKWEKTQRSRSAETKKKKIKC